MNGNVGVAKYNYLISLLDYLQLFCV